MWFGSSASLRTLSQTDKTVVIGGHSVQPSDSVRNLGVHFDSELSMQVHITKTSQICFFQLRHLRQIRRLLGRDVTANLVAALVLSRLDYCNAPLAGLPYSTLAPLHQCSCATRLWSATSGQRHICDDPTTCLLYTSPSPRD